MELKRKYLADKISNFEDKIIILVFNGVEIMYDYDSCSLMLEQICPEYNRILSPYEIFRFGLKQPQTGIPIEFSFKVLENDC